MQGPELAEAVHAAATVTLDAAAVQLLLSAFARSISRMTLVSVAA